MYEEDVRFMMLSSIGLDLLFALVVVVVPFSQN